ncbi:MAG TPA: hypothetical protein VNJ08_13680 [Bacteriovoracaceae bacterium]|nr:hypothetical protein [Bacteriovoracaceae bacterium]
MIDFKICTEKELWQYVASHLESKGLNVVLVGGAVVSIYSEGAYRSGDLDFIITSLFKEKVPHYMSEIGFERGIKGDLGRLYRHPDCKHLVVEFPSGPISIGEDYQIKPDEHEYNGQRIKILSPTDCIVDRLASYIYGERGAHGERKTLEQAVLVAKAQPLSFPKFSGHFSLSGVTLKKENTVWERRITLRNLKKKQLS